MGPLNSLRKVGNQILFFLPAVGRRLADGSSDRYGTAGEYWTSTQQSNQSGHRAAFGEGGSSIGLGFHAPKEFSHSIRCVR